MGSEETGGGVGVGGQARRTEHAPEEQRARLQGKLAGRKPAGALLQKGSGQAGNQTQECVPTRCFDGTGTIKQNSQTGPWGLGKPRKERTGLQAAQAENIFRRPECDPRDTRTGSHFTGSLRARWEPHTLPPQPGRKKTFCVDKTRSIIP